MKNMIISIPNEKDLDFFDEVVKEYPEDTKVFRERGFDAAALFRIIVDASVAIAPHFLAALSLFLTYKIEQRKIKQQEQKLDLERERFKDEKKELERRRIEEQDQAEKFEIKIKAGSHTIVYSNENLNEDNIDIILKDIVSAFGMEKIDE